mmetsp:Transcript_8464/g.12925  ORF Transcript_8464/g.12925 Transcript_8464/m.12925 type:complete len:91 (-) Transcript_8464:17-289(-)
MRDWPPREEPGEPQKNDREKQMKVVNIFHRVMGIFMYFQEVEVHKNVMGWNVKKIPIPRNKRYGDLGTRNVIWKDIEAFLGKEKHKAVGW